MRPSLVRRTSVLVVAAVVCSPASSSAQDSQYWTTQYGNEARLLSGSVIGSVFDLSAVYYNPGRLALVSDPRLVLAGNVFRVSQLTFQDAFGEGLDLKNTRVAGVPSLFAGELRFKFLGDHRLAYSFLTRQDFNFEVLERLEFSNTAEFDVFSTGFLFNQNMDEYWGGLTWAHTLGQKLGLGITTFVAVRSQKTREQTIAQAVDTAGDAGIALQQEAYNFQNWRLLWKIGLGGNFGKHWEAGLSITTPSVSLFGSGKAFFDESLLTQGVGGRPAASDLTTSSQEDLSALYKTPLSIGGGAAYQKGPVRVHASAEWFDAVPLYDVLAPEPVLLPDSTRATFGLTQEFTSVTNVAVGAEYTFNPKVTAYGGFRTDLSAVDSTTMGNTSLSSWDLYHVSGGGTFNIGASNFTVGGIVAWGSDTRQSELELVPGGELIALPSEVKTKFFRFTLILGFAVGF